ncbi:TPA: DUF3380 domain-containing protein [Burkholderia cepacia ATCC 25416]|uniref:N-acetylmuramidase domain-containing protein n=1 Tax=Burkholderia cepacia TaxID=292 RepID=UPI0009C0A72B|nr:N-acetylmuramidase domain-containing protein [Burkholderia cepacia]HDR9766406.1 DUF3380 domain-containing protein [Burkholderia cepacia ATCC 25416]MCA8078939.1 N-acetylmuramidase family protein [Burkholderia cepacia]RRA17171.1 DUF3380 domain-containing protein [Burkholderia cepacia]HDR9782770.1 DUF3380 domain-containing protein [Burkholderia cepacia ATCC 25416]HDR9790262.1 DUF3380 domain-containing protein [Burkholderia cepacia ATCC 25416]
MAKTICISMKKLMRASSLDAEVALPSCSWGGFQILDQNYASCGCGRVFEFVDKFMSGTDGQTEVENVKPEALATLREFNWGKLQSIANGLYFGGYII